MATNKRWHREKERRAMTTEMIQTGHNSFAMLDSPCGTISRQNRHQVSKTGLECGPKGNGALVFAK